MFRNEYQIETFQSWWEFSAIQMFERLILLQLQQFYSRSDFLIIVINLDAVAIHPPNLKHIKYKCFSSLLLLASTALFSFLDKNEIKQFLLLSLIFEFTRTSQSNNIFAFFLISQTNKKFMCIFWSMQFIFILYTVCIW